MLDALCSYAHLHFFYSGVRVQRVVPAADPWTRPFLSIWKLPWQQSEAEGGAAVSRTRTHLFHVSICYFANNIFYIYKRARMFTIFSALWSEDLQTWLTVIYTATCGGVSKHKQRYQVNPCDCLIMVLQRSHLQNKQGNQMITIST